MIKAFIGHFDGCIAKGEAGKEYIDFTSGGIFSAILGPDSQVIKDAMNKVQHFCSYAPRFGNYWRYKYIEALKEFTGFPGVALFSSGTEAIEAFIRFSRITNGKPGIMGGLHDPTIEHSDDKGFPSDSFHGRTLGSMIAAGKISDPRTDRLRLPPEHYGCMIMEPFHAPTACFHSKKTIDHLIGVQQGLKLDLCVDEIQGGMGRTGKLFAHQHYENLKPEFVALGKGLAGGLPMSALVGDADINDWEHFEMSSTNGGNPLMCAVGLAVIEEIKGNALIRRAAEFGEYMTERLEKLPVKSWSKGLLAGIKFKDTEEAAKIVQLCQDRGLLIVDTLRDTVKIGPALTIPMLLLENGLQIFSEVVEEIVNDHQA